MDVCLKLLNLPEVALQQAIKEASTVEILSKIQHLYGSLSNYHISGRPMYKEVVECDVSTAELIEVLLIELEHRLAKRSPGFALQIMTGLVPLAFVDDPEKAIAVLTKFAEAAAEPSLRDLKKLAKSKEGLLHRMEKQSPGSYELERLKRQLSQLHKHIEEMEK